MTAKLAETEQVTAHIQQLGSELKVRLKPYVRIS
jgi:hypothetical protein